tara:strand:- start:629 stop:1690 length:1062 start_codon:yes stop_codon:yes gene_type:complete
MRNFSIIFLVTIILFILFNFVISFTWTLYSKFKNKNHSYPEEVVEILNLSEDDMIKLHSETWESYDKFTYIPFLGHSETKRVGQFVNFDIKNGRKVMRPNNCSENIVMYGGSTLFGYNVTDKETIAQQLQNILGNDYCVFNHGRAYYYSKQENNLFAIHIENNYKIDQAIFLDGVNERCGSYKYAKYLDRSFQILVERPYKMWQKTFVDFLYTLPVIQFTNSLIGPSRWIHAEFDARHVVETCEDKNLSLSGLFQKRLNLRHSLCLEEKIKCFTFLQPFAGTHGKQIEKLLSNNNKILLNKKYHSLKKVDKFLIDIAFVLDDSEKLSYVDPTHYSAESSFKIAQIISTYVTNP